MKLTGIKNIEGKVRVVSGLHIGAGRETLEIGGLDQPIIKHPLTGEPYIPGSSIKGKMRSLLELYEYSANADTLEFISGRKDRKRVGKPCGCGKASCPACRIFGSSADPRDVEPELGPTRLVVRDAVLSKEFRLKHQNGELPMEVKYENTIDRVRGVAQHPRPLERVPAGVEFDFSLSFKIFEGDPEDLFQDVLKGLKLIELDALGGNSSRGCGQVRFEGLTCDGETIELPASI
jgi:CRISPR-associated protein Csm3